jgi:hypothetical protein
VVPATFDTASANDVCRAAKTTFNNGWMGCIQSSIKMDHFSSENAAFRGSSRTICLLLMFETIIFQIFTIHPKPMKKKL